MLAVGLYTWAVEFDDKPTLQVNAERCAINATGDLHFLVSSNIMKQDGSAGEEEQPVFIVPQGEYTCVYVLSSPDEQGFVEGSHVKRLLTKTK